MSLIARRITGLSKLELFKTDFKSINSKEDACYPSGVEVRQSVRAFAELVIGSADLKEERELLRNSTPKAFRLRK